MSPRVTLEAAVTTAEEAARAVEAGADRLELCSALEVGGFTPSPGTFMSVCDRVPKTPIYVLIRPRPGGFNYSDSEFAAILRDAHWFMSNGAAGVVCGVLDERGRIDDASSYDLIHVTQGKCVFHRGFDFLLSQPAALEELIGYGFERVLTSGGALTALQGASRIAELVRQSRGRVEILPGGGITPENVAELIRFTGCTQVHGSFRSRVADSTLNANPEIAAQMGQVMTTNAETVRRVRAALDELCSHQ